MAHSLKEREFLVDKAIELEIFKTMEFDKKNNSSKEFDAFVDEMKSNGVDPSKAYRLVMESDGEERVAYTSRDGLVEALKDEDGFDFIWKVVKEELEEIVDEIQGENTINEDYDEDYEDI